MDQLLPREKLKRFGAEHLTDLELLRILIGSGNRQASAEQIARNLLKLLKERGDTIAYNEVLKVPGMGPAKPAKSLHSSRSAGAISFRRNALLSQAKKVRLNNLNTWQARNKSVSRYLPSMGQTD